MTKAIAKRFRGFLPVVIDVETGGVNPQTDALLEIAAVIVDMDTAGKLVVKQKQFHHILPFKNSILDPESLAFTGIKPDHPFRFAISEKEALQKIFALVGAALKKTKCNRAVLVGHNAWFDLHFLQAACMRCGFDKNPFHRFTSFDTATLAGLAFGQTVLPKALEAAGIDYSDQEAHSALYDAEKTAELFCQIVNGFGMV